MTRKTLTALLLGAALTAGCASQNVVGNYDDPITILMDRTESHRKRWAAARQAEQQLFDDPRRIAALKRLVWERGYPAEYGNYAIDQLLAIDEADARAFFADAIVLIKDWKTLNHLIDTAVARQWVDFVPALVRNYSLRTPVYRDDERPERLAIQKLRPDKSVEAVVLETFAAQGEADVKERVGAWSLLHRLTGNRQQLIDLLNELGETNDALVADLRAGAVELGVVPDNLETVTWLRMLRTEPYRGFWVRAKAAADQLDPKQRAGLQLRHLPVLIYLQNHHPEVLAQPYPALLNQLNQQLARGEHHLKGPTYDAPLANHPQVLSAWTDKLVWADLATMQCMLHLIRQPHLIAEWFKQGDADVVARTTEFGGLVRLNRDGLPIAVAYEPMLRKHNWAYYPPAQLVTDAYVSLAHYHFHAQEHDNGYYSGPGLGDLQRTAGRQQFNGLVLTFMDHDRLNIDYYQVDEVVVDLGTVHR